MNHALESCHAIGRRRVYLTSGDEPAGRNGQKTIWLLGEKAAATVGFFGVVSGGILLGFSA